MTTAPADSRPRCPGAVRWVVRLKVSRRCAMVSSSKKARRNGPARSRRHVPRWRLHRHAVAASWLATPRRRSNARSALTVRSRSTRPTWWPRPSSTWPMVFMTRQPSCWCGHCATIQTGGICASSCWKSISSGKTSRPSSRRRRPSTVSQVVPKAPTGTRFSSWASRSARKRHCSPPAQAPRAWISRWMPAVPTAWISVWTTRRVKASTST